ncbi:enoyl-CoA hydratase/isomerase family protein [Amycolatopsis acidicola]|uniref:Enoyl-CoA hydratase/isomerase family protein n=1 Tax=Amycolatopsis acidicola TaxID=2596893 RepID=A0A5N0UQF5_9PSEU|nr:enoyl-CoA hydratase/isomerase family protein [Amycolatopsis acidicola]KAA9153190.1 enoyl-CoA hydratase/isomerase family protein [Amycolatopsis acidicola]
MGPDVSVLLHEPLVIVRAGEPVPPRGDQILVGVGEFPREAAARLDVTLVPPGSNAGPEFVVSEDPVADAEFLRAAAHDNPQAALVLAQVLRAGGGDVAAALDLESFAYSTLLGGAEFARWLEKRGERPLPPPSTEPVLVERDGARLLITLNRPERRNAYGREVRDALVEALRLAELDDSIERVVLTGAGPSFSAGGDLDEFGTTPDLATAHFVRTRGGAGLLLHRLAERAEVRVQGSCVGAGIELPAFAGRVIAREGTTFRLPEVGMGLIPGAGGTVSIPRRAGRWRTLFLALSGRPLGTTTALEWGLIDAVE